MKWVGCSFLCLCTQVCHVAQNLMKRQRDTTLKILAMMYIFHVYLAFSCQLQRLQKNIRQDAYNSQKYERTYFLKPLKLFNSRYFAMR